MSKIRSATAMFTTPLCGTVGPLWWYGHVNGETSRARRFPSAMRYRLMRVGAPPSAWEPSVEQRRVTEHGKGRLKVLAGPGTGKTATLVEAVADRIERRGIDPASILCLTFSRRAAAELTTRIARRLRITTTEPIVRTLHSYAYALVRQAAVTAGEPAPRLLEAGQADLMVRDILAGHVEDGGRYWPEGLRAAIGTAAFAAELRDVMLRSAERQISPADIDRLARRRCRPEWAAVARFVQEYRDIGDLRTGTTGLGAKLDQAELTAAALACLQQPALLEAQRSRLRHIFVDEYQDVDPAQAALIDMLSGGADELVVVGDPDQAIYAFRGASAGALAHIETDQVVDLTVSRRMPLELVTATRRVASRIPGPQSHRALRAGPRAERGTVEIRTLPSANRQAAFIADRFRRLHLESGVPFCQMAIILRSPRSDGEVLSRALMSAGLPVASGAAEPLGEEPLVAALLTIVRAGAQPESLGADQAAALLTSPIGGLDVLALRRLRRALRGVHAAEHDELGAGAELGRAAGPGRAADPGGPAREPRMRRSADLIADIVTGRRDMPADLPADLDRPLRDLVRLTAIAAAGRHEPAAQDVLWEIWTEARLADRLLEAYERGGEEARRAARHLDAAITLFDRAADLAAQLPSAGVGGLLEVVSHEHLRSARDDGPAAGRGDAVTIISAHSAKGMEWDAVAVAAVQDETWPDLRPRASLLGAAELLDAAAGIEAGVPPADPLADERRLFYVAVTRPRRHLIVTAVDNAETSPSRFLYELAGSDELPSGWPSDAHGRQRRGLNFPELVAELRAATCAGDGAGDEPTEGSNADRAARVLAMLAKADVRGADPASWYGLTDVTSTAPLMDVADPVTLSPSQVESLMQCPLRTVLGRHGGRAETGQSQLVGVAVHALAQGMAAGATHADTDAAIEEFLADQTQLPPWEMLRLRRRMRAMRDALETWLKEHAASRTLAGAEIPIDVTIPGDGGPPVRLRGRIDWVSHDDAGRVVITDFKTGASVPSVADAAIHPQLAVYQVAVALGALADGGAVTETELGGAELVYLAGGVPKIREQAPQTAADRADWVDRLRSAAADATGPRFLAREGEYCARCPVRASCPLRPEGRAVTRSRMEHHR